MPKINDALIIKYNGIDVIRAVYNGVDVWVNGPVFDVDAADYISRVELADEQELELSVKLAYDSFFRGVKTDGDFTKLKSACILAGARTLAGALVPLVAGMPAPTNVGFVAGDRSRATGLKGNGTSKYLNLNRTNNADPLNNAHSAVYITQIGGGFHVVMSDGSGTVTVPSRQIYHNIGATGYILRNRSSEANQREIAGTTGFVGSSRNNSSNFQVLSPTGSEITASFASNVAPTRRTFLLGHNTGSTADNNPNVFASNRVLFYSIGEAVNLTNLRSRLNTLAADLSTL